jgi:xanthine dehydrogenase YagR molybdenum-binding subunit
MAAKHLGVDLSSVTVEVGDTRLPPAPVAGGSNTTASAGNAVMKACNAIRDKIFHAAVTANDGPLAGLSIGELTLSGGKVISTNGASEPLEDVFRRIGTSTLEEYSEFVPDGLKPSAVADLYAGKLAMIGGPHGKKVMYATGAEFVEVRIHALTREIRVPRIVGAFAAGRLMNTRTARSQLMGGMIWGVGSALHEATEIDKERARYVNDNLADYRIPVNADIQQLEVILVSETDTDVNPAGIKGLGELANVGTAAAIANAIYDATGVRVRALPIRIEDLLTA